MGSLLVYKCPHCGAGKAATKLHFMFLCDYCGGLVGFDDFGFARSEHYQKLLTKMQTENVSPGTIPYRLWQLFYHEMEQARLNHERQVWHEKADEYYRLYYDYYYGDFLQEHSDNPRFQLENMARTTLLWYEVSYFDERMVQCWGDYEEAWNKFQRQPRKNSSRQAEQLVRLYTTVLEKLFEIVTPADLEVDCQSQELVRATLNRWFQQIIIDTSMPAQMRQAIADCYEKTSSELRNPNEIKANPQRGTVNVDCVGCGASFGFEDKDGVYSCPQCNTSYRYLSSLGVVSPG